MLVLLFIRLKVFLCVFIGLAVGLWVFDSMIIVFIGIFSLAKGNILSWVYVSGFRVVEGGVGGRLIPIEV